MAVVNYYKKNAGKGNYPKRHPNAPVYPKPEHNPPPTSPRGKRRVNGTGKKK